MSKTKKTKADVEKAVEKFVQEYITRFGFNPTEKEIFIFVASLSTKE